MDMKELKQVRKERIALSKASTEKVIPNKKPKKIKAARDRDDWDLNEYCICDQW